MPRANLNKEKIFSAAATLANRKGFAALSLKELASHFGVKPPSLFKHIRDMAEIKDALAVSGLTKLRDALSEAMSTEPRENLRKICYAYRDLAQKFPGEYDAFQETHVMRSPVVFKLAEDVLLAFQNALPHGVVADKIHTLRFLRSALHGFVQLERNNGFGLSEKVDESFRRMVENLLDIALLDSR